MYERKSAKLKHKMHPISKIGQFEYTVANFHARSRGLRLELLEKLLAAILSLSCYCFEHVKQIRSCRAAVLV